MPRLSYEKAGTPSHSAYREGDDFIRDYLDDDQSIVINVKDKGLVVVTGCAHSGIVNTVDYAKKISQNTLDYKTFLTADRSDAFSMRGALTDVLVADRDSIFMRHMRLNLKLEPQEDRRMHLYSVSSLLDDYGHNRAD